MKISVPKQSIQWQMKQSRIKLSKKKRNNYYILNIFMAMYGFYATRMVRKFLELEFGLITILEYFQYKRH